MELSEFERDKQIDPTQLDVECVQQADLFFKWAERAIDARSQADRLDLAMEVVEAKLQLQVRREPESFDLDDKVTEAAIKSAVQKHPKLKKAKEAYLEARGRAALLEKAVQAMEIKKRMIESLITLHGQQYFAGPGTPRNLTDAWARHQESMGTSVRVKQAKQTRKRSTSRKGKS